MTGPPDDMEDVGPTDEEIDNAYLEAIVASRRRMGALNGELAAQLEQALRAWADQLEARVADLPDQRSRWAMDSATLTREAADELADAVTAATDDARTVAYDDVLDIWHRSLDRIVGDPVEADSLLGTLRVPSLSLLGQFASLNAASHWKTLVRQDAEQAAQEANAIILQALTANVDPEELARRLRTYVEGRETFAHLFHDIETDDGTFAKLNLSRLPRALRGAGRTLAYNARRIAITELHNARAEAEVQYFRADPLVGAVRWQLSPDRGTQVLPDECDILARADFYGLGEGIYPVEAVPAPPHPFDRCERMPVPRSWGSRDDPKTLGEWQGNAWHGVDFLGRGMSRSSWLSTVVDALNAVTLGRAV